MALERATAGVAPTAWCPQEGWRKPHCGFNLADKGHVSSPSTSLGAPVGQIQVL